MLKTAQLQQQTRDMVSSAREHLAADDQEAAEAAFQTASEAMKMAEKICKNGPYAVRTAKEIVVRQADLESGFVLEKAIGRRVFNSEDAQEGPKAFMEKRKPNFVGR